MVRWYIIHYILKVKTCDVHTTKDVEYNNDNIHIHTQVTTTQRATDNMRRAIWSCGPVSINATQYIPSDTRGCVIVIRSTSLPHLHQHLCQTCIAFVLWVFYHPNNEHRGIEISTNRYRRTKISHLANGWLACSTALPEFKISGARDFIWSCGSQSLERIKLISLIIDCRQTRTYYSICRVFLLYNRKLSDIVFNQTRELSYSNYQQIIG